MSVPVILLNRSDDDLIEIADAYAAAAERLRAYVEARRAAMEGMENIVYVNEFSAVAS